MNKFDVICTCDDKRWILLGRCRHIMNILRQPQGILHPLNNFTSVLRFHSDGYQHSKSFVLSAMYFISLIDA